MCLRLLLPFSQCRFHFGLRFGDGVFWGPNVKRFEGARPFIHSMMSNPHPMNKHPQFHHSRLFWMFVIAAASIAHLWLFLHLPRAGPWQLRVTVAIHVVACIGPFWVVADWFVKRRKKVRWQRWMCLLFVPWGFLWYVFEKWEPAKSDLLRTAR